MAEPHSPMRHVYVHVPFCRRRCVYCDFSIAVRREVPADTYATALRAELDVRFRSGVGFVAPLDTIYLGGGTPSLLTPDALARVIDDVRDAAGGRLADDAEVTVEANPEDVTAESAAAWVVAGVNRVSLGAQSFEASVLHWMHRPHGPDAIPRAVHVLREAGVASLSLDLIFGIPRAAGPRFGADLERAVALEPDHLSVYGLTVESHTPLGRWVTRQTVHPAPEERHAAEFLMAHDALSAAGFEHYEVSNYARPGCRARHNSAYWDLRPYLGLGPAAHSFDGAVRRWNVAPWVAWERAARSGRDPVEGEERLTPPQARLERAYLGLRTSNGAPAADLRWPSPEGDRALEAGWLEVAGALVRATPAGWLRLDSLAQALTTWPGGG